MTEPIPITISSVARDPFIEDELRLINRLIDEGLVDIGYQPIVDLRSRSIFAYEALARPRDGYFRTPGDLIDSAVRAHCMGRLGRHLRALAIRGCQRWPIFLNLNPHEFAEPFLVQLDEPAIVNEHPVYLEIGEAVPADFFDHCHGVLAELREKGVQLAIDDFGAGTSSLKYIVDLKPDMVKLHRELIIGCLPGSREFDLLRAITELCHRMNAKVIAEGIETVGELKAALAAGIDYGQGFLLSVPHNPPPSFFWPPELPPDSAELAREYGPVDDPRPFASAAKPAVPAAVPDPDSVNARITIQRLEDELAEARDDLAAALAERSALSERLKRLSHASESPAPKRERPRTPAPSEPAPTERVGAPKNPNEEDALDFLRQIEAERAAREQNADSDS